MEASHKIKLKDCLLWNKNKELFYISYIAFDPEFYVKEFTWKK